MNHAMKNWGDQSKQINLADEDAINEIKNVKEWYVFFFFCKAGRETDIRRLLCKANHYHKDYCVISEYAFEMDNLI